MSVCASVSISFCLFNISLFQMFGNWTFGTLVFTVLVFTVTLKVRSLLQRPSYRCVVVLVSVNGCRLHLLICAVACLGHTLLDVDQPFCHMGLTAFLCHLLTPVGRHHLVRSTPLCTLYEHTCRCLFCIYIAQQRCLYMHCRKILKDHKC